METRNTLLQQWEALKKEQPQLRIRNAAELLKVSEAELLATKIGDTVTLLENKPKEILQEMEPLGKVMALTRNDSAVHERKGIYSNPKIGKSPVGLFAEEDIDLRIFFSHWKYAFAVNEVARGKERHSLQFFGGDGLAIHKIYLTPASNLDAYKELVSRYTAEDQQAKLTFSPYKDESEYVADKEVDVAEFQKAWTKLQDTHQFFGLLTKHKLSRTQALRLAPSEHYARKIEKDLVVEMIEQVADSEVPFMVFVGNRGNIQIHTGPIKKTLWHNQWFNILDPDFNLHLDMDAITDCWVVRKPTTEGDVTAIECFDEKGELIVQFFGKRKPGIPEMTAWREVVQGLEKNLS